MPPELLDDIVGRLSRWSQRHAALVCRTLYNAVIPQLYHSIELVDRRNVGTGDEHDDSPMIRMLLVLAQNPFIASQVRVLMHRCHLPLPDVFGVLQNLSFSDPTLSNDTRTLRLLQLAIQNLFNVHTLRIVLGHHNIVYGLILGFFGKNRPRKCPVRRLWLESSCLDGMELDQLDFRGLKSFRYRRAATLHEAAGRDPHGVMYTLTRRRPELALTDIYSVRTTLARVVRYASPILEDARAWDDDIYQAFPETSAVLARGQHSAYLEADVLPRKLWTDLRDPLKFIGRLLLDSAETLTSFTLDWLLGSGFVYDELGSIFPGLPNLRALQIRNSLFDGEGGARPSTESCLFVDPWLTTLARATDIQCLAWRADFFLPCHYALMGVPEIVRQIILRLGHTLTSLRIDSEPLQDRELITESNNGRLTAEAQQRRLFLEQVAPEMRALEVIKVEGSIPYDERYELMRALKHCPLQKVVIICIHYPGSGKMILEDDDPMPMSEFGNYGDDYASEDEWAEACRIASATKFSPTYGTLTGYTPIIDAIALHHASTITELKLCGFRNAPILRALRPKTALVFRCLKRLHQLRYITTAVSMSTSLDDVNRCDEICAYWLDMQRPSSTAPVSTNVASSDNDRPKFLAELFAPSVLAENVAKLMVPYLSPQALARAPGVTVRALFLMTKDETQVELWELEVVVGPGCRIVSFRGPRAEHDAEKLQEKMENRAWF